MKGTLTDSDELWCQVTPFLHCFADLFGALPLSSVQHFWWEIPFDRHSEIRLFWEGDGESSGLYCPVLFVLGRDLKGFSDCLIPPQSCVLLQLYSLQWSWAHGGTVVCQSGCLENHLSLLSRRLTTIDLENIFAMGMVFLFFWGCFPPIPPSTPILPPVSLSLYLPQQPLNLGEWFFSCFFCFLFKLFFLLF